MPIEIKELHIKVTVSGTPAERPAGGGDGASVTQFTAADRQRLVAECVEQILQILQQKKER